MIEFIGALVSGALTAVPIFLVASGLTVVYGALGVLNFAHGAVFMVGAFLTVQFLGGAAVAWTTYLVVVLATAVACALLAVVVELVAFRRLYRKEHLLGLLASFALLFVLQGAAQRIWGLAPRTQPAPRELSGSVDVAGVVVSEYALATATMSAVVGAVLWLLLRRSAVGKQLQAVADDREMAEAVGIRADRVGMFAFAVSGFLAGAAGAMLAPQGAIDVGLSERYLILGFAIIILGGVGSLRGALFGALGLGVLVSMLSSYAPTLVGFGTFVGLAAGLLLRRRAIVQEAT